MFLNCIQIHLLSKRSKGIDAISNFLLYLLYDDNRIVKHWIPKHIRFNSSNIVIPDAIKIHYVSSRSALKHRKGTKKYQTGLDTLKLYEVATIKPKSRSQMPGPWNALTRGKQCDFAKMLKQYVWLYSCEFAGMQMFLESL